MPRINWKAVERDEDDIENDDTMSPQEKARAIQDLHREVRDEYEEQQRTERDNDFGW